MNLRSRLAWRRRVPVLACCVVVSVVVAASAAAAPRGASAAAAARGESAAAAARGESAAATPRCTATHVQVWFGLGLGGGTLGSVYYPLEFTNVGHHACTLTGYPGVSAFGDNGGQVGPAASHMGQRHGTVTLAPGATAHAILRVVDWGALCSKEVPADGLKVFPPGATRSEPVPFAFGACAHQGVLQVGSINSGVGIPGYTTS